MIIANITSFMYIGAMDAEHYYCSWDISEGKNIETYYTGSNHHKLTRKLIHQSEVNRLNKKDGYKSFSIGDETERFDSISQIHYQLMSEFPNEDIITYEEGNLFKDMLCIINGENHGIKYFGEQWDYLPSSFYLDLLPNDYKIKCEACGVEHDLSKISETRNIEGNRKWVKFKPKKEIFTCCADMELIWNVIF